METALPARAVPESGGADPVDVPPAVLARLAGAHWSDRLLAVLEVAKHVGAAAAFAVDAQGLALGRSGDIGDEGLEETASRLAIVAEQSARMDVFGSRPRALLIEFESRWLSVIEIDDPQQGPTYVAVVAQRPLGDRARALLAEHISFALASESA